MTGFSHLTFTGSGPWSMKMDQSWITGLVSDIVDHQPLEETIKHGGVLILQAEPNAKFRDAVLDLLRRMPWCVLIATSDETATYEWHEADGQLPNVRYWVQSPRPENPYPDGARFFGIGCPQSNFYDVRPPPLPASERPVDAAFRGQMQNLLRLGAVDGLVDAASSYNIVNEVTEGFLRGLDRDEYLAELETVKVAICPAGSTTQDTFRLYEALEAGCIPIVDAFRADGGGSGFWDMIGLGWLRQNHYGWHLIPEWLDLLNDLGINGEQIYTQDRYQAWQADIAARLLDDIESLSGEAFT